LVKSYCGGVFKLFCIANTFYVVFLRIF